MKNDSDYMTEAELQKQMEDSEEEYSVTVTASYAVMAESQESAEKYILQQFIDGNISYTQNVEIV